jgi:hypothetical protein
VVETSGLPSCPRHRADAVGDCRDSGVVARKTNPEGDETLALAVELRSLALVAVLVAVAGPRRGRSSSS